MSRKILFVGRAIFCYQFVRHSFVVWSDNIFLNEFSNDQKIWMLKKYFCYF